jgi:hypothetical protein
MKLREFRVMLETKGKGKCQLRYGYYETWYGNVATYRGGLFARDVDANEKIPVTMLDKFMRPFDE